MTKATASETVAEAVVAKTEVTTHARTRRGETDEAIVMGMETVATAEMGATASETTAAIEAAAVGTAEL